MLDAARSFTVPGLDQVRVYPDDREVGGFYPVSTSPRVVVGSDGSPEIDLTVYGRREHGTFQATGGILTLTTSLEVAEADRVRLRAALTRRLAEEWPVDSAEEPPTPQLLAPEWVTASVDVRLTADLTLTGQPSMAGDNRCSFSLKLSADQATDLYDAWGDGLPEATISYRGQLRSGAGAAGVGIGSSSSRSSTSVTTRSSSSSTGTSATAGDGDYLQEVRSSESWEAPAAAADAPSAEVDVSAPLAATVPDVAERASTVEF